jgi:hypothetical protein
LRITGFPDTARRERMTAQQQLLPDSVGKRSGSALALQLVRDGKFALSD